MKKAKQVQHHSVVLVVWRDAHAGFAGSWATVEDLDPEPCLVRSSGFLLEDVKPGHITIAQSILEKDFIDNILHVPQEMVDSITHLCD